MLTRNIQVLVVDDVILMCDFLYGVANKVSGCRAFKALDGKAASEILENERIDLLVTDIEIKAPSGLELAQRVRCGIFSQTPHDIPIVMFSGNAYREVIAQSMAFDVNDFLAKPITSAVLTKKFSITCSIKKRLNPLATMHSWWPTLIMLKR